MTNLNNRRSIFSSLILGIVFLFFIGIMASCTSNDEDISSLDCIDGEGAFVTRTLSVADFKKVDLAMATNIVIKQGNTQEVKAMGHSNIIDLISTSVKNNTWEITTEKDVCIRNYKLSFEITVPNIEKLIISGSGDIDVDNFENQNNFTLEVNGSGDIKLNKFEGITKLDVALSGSGSIKAQKKIASLKDLNITVSGSGGYDGYPVSCDNSIVNVLGSGNVKLTANKTLKVTISGSGSVHYKGTPTITKTISGSGSVINAN